MGVEIFKYALPAESSVISDCKNGRINGEILQTIKHLISELKDGEPSAKFIDELNGYYSSADINAVRQTFDLIQESPHLLAVAFDGASRGHDHWAYLLELAASPECKELARSVVFGSQAVSESAIGSQGIPIRWSSAVQVNNIHKFVRQVDFDSVRKNLLGSPNTCINVAPLISLSSA